MTIHSVSGSPANTGGWQVVVYETPSGKHPALEYLSAASVPDQPRRELLLTVFAVAEMGPLNFPTGTTRWRLMHKAAKKGEVDMSGIFEARDQHNRSCIDCSACWIVTYRSTVRQSCF